MTVQREIATGDPVVFTENGQRWFAECMRVPGDPSARGTVYEVGPLASPWALPKGGPEDVRGD